MSDVENSLIPANSNMDDIRSAILATDEKHTTSMFTVAEPVETNILLEQLLAANTSKSSRLNEDFDIVEVVNTGGFGLVYRARHKLDRRIYAVKEVPIKLSPYYTKGEFNEKLQQIFSEVYLLSRLDTSYVLRYYNCWLEKSTEVTLKELKERNDTSTSLTSGDTKETGKLVSISLFISMEIASRGTLKDVNTQEMSLKTKLSMLIQITQAVSYLHKNQVAHRDITPSNIFVADNNKLKLGDFGLSTHPFFYVDSNDGLFPYKEELNVKLRKNKSVSLRGQRKKPSSKIFSVQSYNQSSIGVDIARDCYSVGIIMIEFLVDFGTNMERVLFFKKIKKYIEDEKYGLIRAMLQEHIKRRDIVDIILNITGDISKRRNMEWVKRKLCAVFKRNKYSNGK